MLYREIIVVYFEKHTKHINTLCGQNAERDVMTRWLEMLVVHFIRVAGSLVCTVRRETETVLSQRNSVSYKPHTNCRR